MPKTRARFRLRLSRNQSPYETRQTSAETRTFWQAAAKPGLVSRTDSSQDPNRDGIWLDKHGSPLTDAAKMTERIRRVNYGNLEIEVTIDDPKAYTRPWIVKLNQFIVLNTDLLDYICLENEKDIPHLIAK